MTFGRHILALPLALALASTLRGGPAGAPTLPPGSEVNTQLSAHPLKYAPGPLDNPLKGFIPYHFKDEDYDQSYAHSFPFSMEWAYFPLNQVMQDWAKFDWSGLEKVLDEIASRGKQAVIRVYVEYPGRPSGLPDFLRKSGIALRKIKGVDTESPDYDDPRTIKAFTQFIAAYGKKYDGDPRIGFITMGLVGLWGEWHTWPAPELFPKNETVKTYIDAYVKAFPRTQVEIRYGDLGGGYCAQVPVGFHDDSWCYRESADGKRKSGTLTPGLGGWDWGFMGKILSSGTENRWITQSMGGEVRPEIQTRLFRASEDVDPVEDCVEVTHVTWLLNQKGIESYHKDDPKAADTVRKMGYELWVRSSHFNSKVGSSFKVGVLLENKGVAPFYYPWQLLLAAKNAQGKIVKTWPTNWDLRKVMPSRIRILPDWKLATREKYMPFGKPYYFETSLDAFGLPKGKYALVMRVANPLESLKESEMRARGTISASHPFLKPKALRFANQEQGEDGWLRLGEIEFSAMGSKP